MFEAQSTFNLHINCTYFYTDSQKPFSRNANYLIISHKSGRLITKKLFRKDISDELGDEREVLYVSFSPVIQPSLHEP